MSTDDLPQPNPFPYKLAVVGSAFCVEPSEEMRARIEGAVHAALSALPEIEVHATYFMWGDTRINLTTVKINDQEALDGQ